MSYVIDEVARSLANPTPRRKAFRLIGGILVGAFFATRQEAHAQGKSKGVCGKPGGGSGSNCGKDMCCCKTTSQLCVSSVGAGGGNCAAGYSLC